MNRPKARDAAWTYAKPFVGKYNSKAKNPLAALKSFYRNEDGETLPFDSRRGGRHYVPERRTKAQNKHVPNKAEMYQIIDGAHTIRDRAVLLVLFQSGLRVDALCNLRYKDVKSQLYPEMKIPLNLKITDDIDTKTSRLRHAFLQYFFAGRSRGYP